MAAFDLLAERKIAEAISRGELDDLPGAGRPLELDDEALIPEDLRVAYRILKNAGFLEGSSAKELLQRKVALLRTARESRPARRRART